MSSLAVGFDAEMQGKGRSTHSEGSITNCREIPYVAYDVIHREAAYGCKDRCHYAWELVEQV